MGLWSVEAINRKRLRKRQFGEKKENLKMKKQRWLNIKVQNTSTELNIVWFGHMTSKGLNWDQRCVGFNLNCSLLFFFIGLSLACMAGLISEAT